MVSIHIYNIYICNIYIIYICNIYIIYVYVYIYIYIYIYAFDRERDAEVITKSDEVQYIIICQLRGAITSTNVSYI